MRELVLEGWDAGSLSVTLASITGFTIFGSTLTLAALRWRTG
jgi:hypothetical protein